MQMAIMSEGLPQKLKCIKIGREERGFQAFLTQPPLVIVCHVVLNHLTFIYLWLRLCNPNKSLDAPGFGFGWSPYFWMDSFSGSGNTVVVSILLTVSLNISRLLRRGGWKSGFLSIPYFLPPSWRWQLPQSKWYWVFTCFGWVPVPRSPVIRVSPH